MKTVATSKPRPAAPRPAHRPSRITRAVGALGRGVATFLRRKPGIMLAMVVLAGGGGAFGWNALTQNGRHPAPLFAPKPDPASVEPPRRPETLAQLPAPTPAIAPPTRPPEPAAVRTEPSRPDATARRETPPARASAAGDPNGALIRASDPSARINELAKGGETAKPAPDAGRITAVQRALTKLGYGPLKEDGIMGAGTRQALERFERERKLPVSGALPVRTMRQLAALSGVSVE